LAVINFLEIFSFNCS